MPSTLSDTHLDIARIQTTISRSMPSWRKFRLVNDLIVSGRKLALADCASGFLMQAPGNFAAVSPPYFSAQSLPERFMVPNPILPPSADPTEPFQVLQRVIASMEALGIRYMLAGPFASSLHGLPRLTQDADLIVDLYPGRLDAFAQAFAPDFYVDRGIIRQALERRTSFNIIHFESSFKVDFFVLGGVLAARATSDGSAIWV
jgi:hypothetical protein